MTLKNNNKKRKESNKESKFDLEKAVKTVKTISSIFTFVHSVYIFVANNPHILEHLK